MILTLNCMINQEIHKALDFCLGQGLDFSVTPSGMVSVFKWNRLSQKIEWKFTWLPSYGSLMENLEKEYKQFKQTDK